jgi:hypothetical protein
MSSARARQAAGRDKSAGCDVAQKKASLDKGEKRLIGTPAAVLKNGIFPKKTTFRVCVPFLPHETPKPRDENANHVDFERRLFSRFRARLRYPRDRR